MVAATQFINVQRGTHEVAIDLSAQHAQSLRNNNRVGVKTQPSTWVFWLFANNNPDISAATPNKRFQSAVRYALDYRSFVALAGAGAIQARGIIPSMFLGALPPGSAVSRNLTRARAELAASGVGDQTFTVEYPSDLTINGVAFATLAQRVQANLQDIGLKVELAGAPVGTWLDKYRNGTMAFGLSLWGPDYPDPADYLAFMPGELVGTRVGWPKGSDQALERLAARARVTTSDAARAPIYRQIQQRLNQTGPVLPADSADAGLRVDEGSPRGGLQPALLDRRALGTASGLGRSLLRSGAVDSVGRPAHALTMRSGGKRFSFRPPSGSQTTTSSIRTPKRPSTRIDGSSVKVMPASSERLLLLGDERALVDVQADAVPHAVLEVRAVASVLDRLPAGAVDLTREHARPERRSAGFLCGENEVVSLADLRPRLADADRSAEVRAVPVDDGAEVEHHDVSLLDRLAVALLGGVLAAHEAGEDVRRERRHARAEQPHRVLELLDELQHRRAGPDLWCDHGDRVVAYAAGALHDLELLG